MTRATQQCQPRGIALLEVLVALAVFTAAALALLARLDQAAEQQRQLKMREAELVTADRVLTAMSLLSRDDLDRRLGERMVGEFVVEVQRPEPMLYRVAIHPAARTGADLLATVVYRPSAP